MPGTAEPRNFIQNHLNKMTIERFDDVKTLMAHCDPKSPELNPNLSEIELLVKGLTKFYGGLDYKDENHPLFRDIENYIAICIGVYSNFYLCWDPHRNNSIRCVPINAVLTGSEVTFDVEAFITQTFLKLEFKSRPLVYKGVALHSKRTDLPAFMKQASSKGNTSEMGIDILLYMSLYEIKLRGTLRSAQALLEHFTDQNLISLDLSYNKPFGFINYLQHVFQHIKVYRLSDELYQSLYSMLTELRYMIIRVGLDNPLFNGASPSTHSIIRSGKFQLANLEQHCLPLIDQILLLTVIDGQIKIEQPAKGRHLLPLLSNNVGKGNDEVERLVKINQREGAKYRANRAEVSACGAMAALLCNENTVEEQSRYFFLTYIHDIFGLFQEHPVYIEKKILYQNSPAFQVLSLLRSENQNTLFPSFKKLERRLLLKEITTLYCIAADTQEPNLSEMDKKLLLSICTGLECETYYYQALAHGKTEDLVNKLNERNSKSKIQLRSEGKATAEKELKEAQPEVKVDAGVVPMPLEPTASRATMDLQSVTPDTSLLQQVLKQQQALTELVLKQNEQIRILTETVKRLESQLLGSNNTSSVTSSTFFNKP